MDKVVVVTVTYNDADYLKKCIDALLKQTVPIYKIIVVDNNSNQQNKITLNELVNNKITFLTLEENLGGAGGFKKGMEFARQQYSPDWYWIMDADAYPRENCLENLIKHKDDVDDVGYLAPLIFGVDLQQFQLYHHKRLGKYLERDIPLYKIASEIPDVSPIEADAFVGPLFSRKAIETVGVADDSLFIYGDDLEYTYRVTRKFKGLLVKDAIINHRDQPASNGVQQPKNWWKDYYMYRNRILFIKKYQISFLLRVIGIFLVVLRCFKQTVICLFSKQDKKLKRLRIKTICKALYDGISEKSGKTIDPGKYSCEIDKIIK